MAKKVKKEVAETPEVVATAPKAPVEKSTGLLTAIRLGEITAKQAVTKLKEIRAQGGYVPVETMAYYVRRASREGVKTPVAEEVEN